MPDIVFHFVDQFQLSTPGVVKTEIGGIYPRVGSGQQVWNPLQIRLGTRRLHPLDDIVRDSVLDQLDHIEDPQPAQPGYIPIPSEHPVTAVFLPVGGQRALLLAANRHPHPRHDVSAYIDIAPAAVAVVGEIGLFVVFKAIDPEIVVHIYSEEELGAIDAVAQERLFVIGNVIRPEVGVVLVEIGDKIVVLVPARKNFPIRPCLVDALPVGRAILIVVVLDEFVEKSAFVGVVDVPVRFREQASSAVVVIHAVEFAKKEEGIGPPRQIDHPGTSLVGVHEVFGEFAIGVFAEAPAAIKLGVQVKAQQIVYFDGAAEDIVARGQAVIKAHQAQIGAVLYIARSPRLSQEDRLALGQIGLAIRPHLNAVVIGHGQFDGDLADSGKIRAVVRAVLAGKIIGQHDLFAAVGREKAPPAKPSIDEGAEADLAAAHRLFANFDLLFAVICYNHNLGLGLDDDIVGKQRSSTFAIRR